jgi:oxygen-independent coproporphyrinogen-3 oxidase
LGVQSLHDPFLQKLGRIHDARTAYRAMEAAASSGFRAFNIDLMYGLPGQTAADAAADIRQALTVNPPHLSLYELTIEAHTAFAHTPPELPEEAERAAIEEVVQDLAQEAGLERYEVSAYARPGYRCLHNLNYWKFGDYLGLGAGAHSKITDATGVIRAVRAPDPQRYLEDNSRVLSQRRLADADILFEFLLNGLRLTQGFSRKLLQERTGHDIEDLGSAALRAVRDGLLIVTDDRVTPTPRGRQFLDSLLTLLLTHIEATYGPRAEAS